VFKKLYLQQNSLPRSWHTWDLKPGRTSQPADHHRRELSQMMRHRSFSKTPHFFNRLWGVWVLTTEADLDETASTLTAGHR
jgi:hypothetical protein